MDYNPFFLFMKPQLPKRQRVQFVFLPFGSESESDEENGQAESACQCQSRAQQQTQERLLPLRNQVPRQQSPPSQPEAPRRFNIPITSKETPSFPVAKAAQHSISKQPAAKSKPVELVESPKKAAIDSWIEVNKRE
jgi:hypothetical protein